MRVYLDSAASTRVDDRVISEMMPYFNEKFAVPSSQFSHSFGIETKDALDHSRGVFLQVLHGKFPEEIIFTSGGAEANNLAIIGTAFANRNKGKHLITTQVEHLSVLNSFKYLEKNGFEVTYLPVDYDGRIDIDFLKKALRKDTILVSVQYGNHETGTVQDIKTIAQIVKENNSIFHTDATIAWPYLSLNPYEEGIDLITISPHKFYGPKGVGVLFVKKGVKINKILHGGFNEFNLRPGTENIPSIVGAAKAVEIFDNSVVSHVLNLKERLVRGIEKNIKHVERNGSVEFSLPHIVNYTFDFVEGEAISLRLDFEGIGVITGSACYSKNLQASYILMSMGRKHEQAHGSIRFSLSKYNTEEEIDYTIEKLKEVIKSLRDLSPLGKE